MWRTLSSVMLSTVNLLEVCNCVIVLLHQMQLLHNIHVCIDAEKRGALMLEAKEGVSATAID